jgi:hypothetical protein
MLKNAVDVKREYLEKNYPDIIERIISAINSAIETYEYRSTVIVIDSSEWRNFNYCDIEWYVKSFGYECKLDDRYINLHGDPRKHVYIIEIDWYLE